MQDSGACAGRLHVAGPTLQLCPSCARTERSDPHHRLHPQSAGHGVFTTPVHAAALRGYTACLRLLLAHGEAREAINYRTGWEGRTALTCATAGEGCAECVELLLRAGADTEALDHDSWTALLFACSESYVGCVRALLAGGASPNPKTPHARAPLSLAALRGNAEIAEMLIDAGAALDGPVFGFNSLTPLMAAAENFSARCFSLLLRRGASAAPAAAAPGGRSALARLCENARLREMAGGPDEFSLPLHIREDQVRRHLQCWEELLLQRGPAALEAADGEGRTPLALCGMQRALHVPAQRVLPQGTGHLLALRGCAAAPPPRGSDSAEAWAPPSAEEWTCAVEVAETILEALRTGPAKAAARMRRELAAETISVVSGGGEGIDGNGEPLAQLRVLLRRGKEEFAAPGEAWWGEDPAQRVPSRLAAVLLDRAARAPLLRECAERAETEAASRALRALQHWRQLQPCAAEADDTTSDAALLLGRERAKAAFAACVCVGKWGEIAEAAAAARREEAAAEAALSGAVAQFENRVEELRGQLVAAVGRSRSATAL